MTVAETKRLKEILIEGGFITETQWNDVYFALLKSDLIRPKVSGA